MVKCKTKFEKKKLISAYVRESRFLNLGHFLLVEPEILGFEINLEFKFH